MKSQLDKVQVIRNIPYRGLDDASHQHVGFAICVGSGLAFIGFWVWAIWG